MIARSTETTSCQDKKRNKCCCPTNLKVLPEKGDEMPGLDGGGSLNDTWGKWVEGDPLYKDATPGQYKVVKGALYGTKADKLGLDESDSHVFFKFQVIGEFVWVEWDGPNEPDCVFSQRIASDDPLRGPLPPRPDVSDKFDINKDVGVDRGVRRKIGKDKYAYEDPTKSDKKGKGRGTWKREFTWKFSSGDPECPCSVAAVVRTGSLKVDTGARPPTADFRVF